MEPATVAELPWPIRRQLRVRPAAAAGGRLFAATGAAAVAATLRCVACACLGRAIFPPPDMGSEGLMRFRRHENGALGGMHTPLRYEVLEHVLSVVTLSRPLVAAIARKDRDLASQVRRALSSVGLNVAEAFGSASGLSRLCFETARGSLYEAQAGIRIAIAWGYFRQEQAAAALRAIDELGGRVYGLSQR